VEDRGTEARFVGTKPESVYFYTTDEWATICSESQIMIVPCLLAAWLVLSVDNMNASASGHESLNGVAEP